LVGGGQKHGRERGERTSMAGEKLGGGADSPPPTFGSNVSSWSIKS
jgi:hypothetical protein